MPNHLQNESSPYLKQHASNPVDWWPWCDEAFAEAARLDKPVFLSIGYSTCHWCHVMAHESFENDRVAAALNESFLCIKLDREERPDIDHVYMKVCQVLTGHGGWPLTVLLDHDRQPFFAGTYFPPESRSGRPGVLDLCREGSRIWKEEQGKITTNSRQILSALKDMATRKTGRGLAAASMTLGAEALLERHDSLYHGFGNRPKFPSPQNLLLLLAHGAQSPSESGDRALAAALDTLLAMCRGGIFDHVDGGFHRYSTDREWHLPHFEKMLYDQATMLLALSEGLAVIQAGHAPVRFAHGEELELERALALTVACLQENFLSPDGLFYSAHDADAGGVEGAFQTWKWSELEELLDDEELRLAAHFWSIRPVGNWRDEASGRQEASNILHQHAALSQLAEAEGLAPDVLLARVETLRIKLKERRDTRVKPGLDDKVLCDWNGLAIASLARAARLADRLEWGRLASVAASQLLARLRDSEGLLLHARRPRSSAIPAMLDDYAMLIFALLEIHALEPEAGWALRARELQRDQNSLFWLKDQELFAMSAEGHAPPLERPVESHDGAMPCGNSISFSNLLRLARLFEDDTLEAQATQLAESIARREIITAGGHSMLLIGLGWRDSGMVLKLPAGSRMKDWLEGSYQPFLDPEIDHELNGEARICGSFGCLPPVRNSAALAAQLRSIAKA
jgi:uncharacterized protein YyaL (SSP411 family)